MGIRDTLKQREEKRSTAGQGSSINEGLPEGITRYVRASELKDGKPFVLLADPDSWYFYYTHEDGSYSPRATYVRKHTCLNSPRQVGANFSKFEKPNGGVCISCKAKAKRKLYFMIPVFDFEFNTWRVLDFKEFHAMNIISDYDKLEKAVKKFNAEYTLVGDVAQVKTTSDGKSFSLESADSEGREAAMEEAKKLIGAALPYEELANFREVDDIVKLLEEADATKIDKSVLAGASSATTPSEAEAPPITGEAPAVNF